jgi:hypothetical protein
MLKVRVGETAAGVDLEMPSGGGDPKLMPPQLSASFTAVRHFRLIA